MAHNASFKLLQGKSILDEWGYKGSGEHFNLIFSWCETELKLPLRDHDKHRNNLIACFVIDSCMAKNILDAINEKQPEALAEQMSSSSGVPARALQDDLAFAVEACEKVKDDQQLVCEVIEDPVWLSCF